MALTLTDALAAPTTLAPAIRLTITGTVPDAIGAGYQFRLEDEVLELKYFGKTEETILGGAATQTVDDRNVWYAQRGVDNTAIVSHIATTAVKGVADALLAGTTEVVPTPPFGSSGGTTDHAALTSESREAADQHPQSAITDLEADLAAAGRHTVSDTAPVDPVEGDIWVQTYDDTGLTPPPTDLSYPAFVWGGSIWLPFGSAAVDALGNLRTLIEHVLDGGLNLYTYQANGKRRCSVTLDDGGIGVWWRNDAGVVRAALNAGSSPDVVLQVNDASGDQLSSVAMTATGVELSHAQGAHTVVVDATGVAVATSGAVKLNLPTADPAVAGALYSNAGVVMVSAG